MMKQSIILIAPALVGCFESRSSSFKTLDEAMESGLVAKGWIPPELPGDATDIRVRWNLDTNLSEGSYQSKQLVEPGSQCSPWLGEAGAIRCGSYHFRTKNGRRIFSNSGLT